MGEAVVEIDVDDRGTVALTATIGQNDFFALCPAAAVTAWCRETSVLVQGALQVTAGDSVEVRGPMLVAQPQGCIAAMRRVLDTGSQFRLVFSPSPQELARGVGLESGMACAAQMQAFLAAFSGAAVAATQPDVAE